VKSVIADDSVGFPHVKVGHYQVIILKNSPPNLFWSGFFCVEKSSCNDLLYRRAPSALKVAF
jgi:hypothetical protein